MFSVMIIKCEILANINISIIVATDLRAFWGFYELETECGEYMATYI